MISFQEISRILRSPSTDNPQNFLNLPIREYGLIRISMVDHFVYELQNKGLTAQYGPPISILNSSSVSLSSIQEIARDIIGKEKGEEDGSWRLKVSKKRDAAGNFCVKIKWRPSPLGLDKSRKRFDEQFYLQHRELMEDREREIAARRLQEEQDLSEKEEVSQTD